jgi:hypothetical protein
VTERSLHSPEDIEFIEVVDWDSYQYSDIHKKPSPPWKWFRIPVSFIQSPIWMAMTRQQRGDFPGLLAAASQTGNMIPNDAKWLRNFGVSPKILMNLIQHGLIRVFSLPANDQRVKELRRVFSGRVPTQKRVDKKRLEKRESRREEALSDGLKAGTQDRRAPPDFEVTKVLQDWAAKNFPSVDIDKETAKFRRHEFPTPRSDWDAAWKTWIQWAAEYQERNNGPSDQPSASDELLKLGKDLKVERQSGESESDYLDRITEINQRRIDGLNH